MTLCESVCALVCGFPFTVMVRQPTVAEASVLWFVWQAAVIYLSSCYRHTCWVPEIAGVVKDVVCRE